MEHAVQPAANPFEALVSSKNLALITTVSAILLGIVFIVSGSWKMLDPFRTGELLEEARVPAGFGILGAATLGTIEVLTAFLLFTPRYRRWGGILGTALLVFFIGWIAYYYKALVGQECSCFPFIKRAVNPMFFVSDGIMLLFSLAAWFGSAKVQSAKIPAIALGVLIALATTSYAIGNSRLVHAQLPGPIVVNGQPVDLTKGKVFLFFYDPSCMHCDAAARFMSGFEWNDTRVVSIPTVNPQWAKSFLSDTKLKADTSLELDKLKAAFPFGDPPYGVVLKNGVVKGTFGQAMFAAPSPKEQFKTLGIIK